MSSMGVAGENIANKWIKTTTKKTELMTASAVFCEFTNKLDSF